jgi:hypothetical protein
MTRLHRPWLRWMVLATFWLAALVPALALARAALAGELPTPGALCRSLAAGRSADPDLPQSGMVSADCPFCWLQAQGQALPPAPPRLPLASERFLELPARFLSAPRSVHAWRRAPARAPPATV